MSGSSPRQVSILCTEAGGECFFRNDSAPSRTVLRQASNVDLIFSQVPDVDTLEELFERTGGVLSWYQWNEQQLSVTIDAIDAPGVNAWIERMQRSLEVKDYSVRIVRPTRLETIRPLTYEMPTGFYPEAVFMVWPYSGEETLDQGDDVRTTRVLVRSEIDLPLDKVWEQLSGEPVVKMTPGSGQYRRFSFQAKFTDDDWIRIHLERLDLVLSYIAGRKLHPILAYPVTSTLDQWLQN